MHRLICHYIIVGAEIDEVWSDEKKCFAILVVSGGDGSNRKVSSGVPLLGPFTARQEKVKLLVIIVH